MSTGHLMEPRNQPWTYDITCHKQANWACEAPSQECDWELQRQGCDLQALLWHLAHREAMRGMWVTVGEAAMARQRHRYRGKSKGGHHGDRWSDNEQGGW